MERSRESLVNHFCCFYETPQQQVLLGLPLIGDGLREGDRCIVIGEEDVRSLWERGLVELGIEAARQASLSFWRGEALRIPGPLLSLPMARHVWSIIERALEDHHDVRMVVDMSCVFTGDTAADEVCHLEATLDHLYAQNMPVKVLCQYDLGRLPAPMLHAGLRTHPWVLAGDRHVQNPYYEAPRILDFEPALNACSADAASVHQMIERVT
jgi:hypothetical protein